MYDSVFYGLHSRRNEFFPDRENTLFSLSPPKLSFLGGEGRGHPTPAQDHDFSLFLCGKEKLVAPLIAIPNVDKANRRHEKGKKLN
jgi:hypothetical protein